MGGIAVLFLLGLYFVLTVVAIVKAKPLWAKGLVLLAALLIPTADAVYGRIKLQQMCKAEGGLKVYRVAENVEGFMADSTSEFTLSKYGFQFTEGDSSPNKYYRFSKQNGQIIREENVTPKSQYRLSLKFIGDMKDRFIKNQYVIDSMIKDEVLATDTQIAFNGSWAERFLAQFSDSGGGTVAWCTNTELDVLKRIDRIITSTLNH